MENALAAAPDDKKEAEKKPVVPAARPVKKKTQEELAALAQYVQTTQGILNLNGRNITDTEVKLFLPYFKVRCAFELLESF